MTNSFHHIEPKVIFQNTTTSYKFFWSIAILNLHKLTGKTIYTCDEVIIRMICEAYFVLENNKIRLGNADFFRSTMASVKKWYPVGCHSQDGLFSLLSKDKYKSYVRRLVAYYRDNVPFRFLTPWVLKDSNRPYVLDKTLLEQESIMFSASAPYVIYKDDGQWVIKINPQWVNNYGKRQEYLIRIVINCLADYIIHRNTLSKEQCVSYLESVVLDGKKVSISLNKPVENTVPSSSPNLSKTLAEKERETKSTQRLRDNGSSQKTEELMVPKPSVPTENIIRNGKIVALGDKELLNKLSPLVEYNKLEAVKFLINHFSGHSELNMTFKDWALLVDTIPAIEKSISHPPRDLVTSSHLSEQGRPQPTIRTEPLKPAKTSRSSARLNSSGWEEVDHAIIGIDSIHDIFGDHEDFPSFVVGSMSMDGFSVTLKIKAWSFKTDKRYIISLLFNEVTYYHASLYLNNEQSFRIVCKKDFGKYKYKVGDSNIYINSSKAIVLGISEL